MAAQGKLARKFLSRRRALRGRFLQNPAEITHIPGYRTEFLKRLVFGWDIIKPDAEPMRQPITSHQSPVTARTRFASCPPRAFVVSRSRSTSALPVPARSMKLSCFSNSTFPRLWFLAKNNAADTKRGRFHRVRNRVRQLHRSRMHRVTPLVE